ncbi:MAG TPA: hypothetical protein VGC30_05520 [Dokdonella sp.]
MKHLCIGSLGEDARSLAQRVCATEEALITVWVNDEATVYASPGETPEDVVNSALVGTYTMGMDPNHIADDLIEMRRERLRAGILDD